MSPTEIIRLFHGNPRKSRQVVKCPSHDDRAASLSLTDMKNRMRVVCMAGCAKVDILAAVGITWHDLYYQQREKLDPKAYAEAKHRREAEEARARNLRIGGYVLQFL